jgi:hypothetical protein
MKWQYGIFPIITAAGERRGRVGWISGPWGLSCGDCQWSIFHLPSGHFFTAIHGGLPARAVAKAFCERIDPLTDWNVPLGDLCPDLGRRIHRIALELTGSRPDLRLLQGGQR